MKPTTAAANPQFVGCGNQGAQVRRQVYELTLDDLRKFPIWEFSLEGPGKTGSDEATLRPCTASGPLDPADRMFIVSAIFTLADHSHMQGYCTPPHRGDTSIGALQPIIVSDRGQVRFWCGTSAPSPNRLARNYEWLGRDALRVFPLRFESAVELVGGPVGGRVPGFLVLEDFQTRTTRTVV